MDALEQAADARVAEVAREMGAGLDAMANALLAEMRDAIPELRGDQIILDLLQRSIQSNVETFFHAISRHLPIEDVSVPPAAIEYARRLAQRGTSSAALTRAYRVGQRRVLTWALAEIAREEPDGRIAFAAAQVLQDASFAYVDRVIERVVAEYEAERERWLANRNTVRATTLATLLEGEPVHAATAEGALGYRLGGTHVGVVAWALDHDGRSTELRSLESLVVGVADAVGAAAPLFVPQDRAVAWAWIPLAAAGAVDLGAARGVIAASPGLHLALGAPGRSVEGFRVSHHEALRAHRVATLAGDLADRVTSYDDPGVRAASMLAADLEAARLLVTTTLGPLATDGQAESRMRETLSAFLDARGSFVAVAERLHVHKNTVKYRVDKALEICGRDLDRDRLDLELALVGARWLGRSVLPVRAGRAQPMISAE